MKKDVKESAKMVRIVLKENHPAVKFSVRISRFAGGSSVEISWTDGPTESEVGKLTAHLKGYHNGFYNEYIITSRWTSREVMEAAARAAAEYYEVPVPEVLGGDNPYLADMTLVDGFSSIGRPEPLCDKVHRAARNVSTCGKNLAEMFESAYPN